jgi:hypothetical protein
MNIRIEVGRSEHTDAHTYARDRHENSTHGQPNAECAFRHDRSTSSLLTANEQLVIYVCVCVCVCVRARMHDDI